MFESLPARSTTSRWRDSVSAAAIRFLQSLTLLARREIAHAGLDQGADFFEFGVVGAAEPFEGDGFGGGHDDAGAFEAADSHFMIERGAAADGVDGEIDPKTFSEQIKGRVENANVRFDASQDDAFLLGEIKLGHKGLDRAAAKADFLGPGRGNFVRQGRDGGAEAFRILFGGDTRDFEQGGDIEQKTDVLHDAVAAVNFRKELLLNVDDDER